MNDIGYVFALAFVAIAWGIFTGIMISDNSTNC